MIVINEFLPNPVGADAEGEWVELWNNGPAPVNLSGWRLENAAGKKHFLSGAIKENGYVVLPRNSTKLTLRNTDEKLTLYNASGGKEGSLAFPGTAPEGKSVGRFENEFSLMTPSPGAENAAALQYPVQDHIQGAALVSSLGPFSVVGLALAAGALLASASAFIYMHTHEEKDLIR